MSRYANEHKDYWYDEIRNAIKEIKLSGVMEVIADILKDEEE